MKRPDYRLEQSGAVLKHFPLQILCERGQITDWSCSEAPSLTNPLWISQITGWSWCEALSFANPWRKALEMIDYRLELVCTTFPCKSLTKSYEKGGLRIGAVLKHLPLQILYEKVWLQTRAGLEHFPLQILDAKAWLYTWAVLKRSPLQIHRETAGNYKSEMITFEKSFKNHRSKFD